MDFGVVVPIADEGVVQLEACLGFLRAAHPDVPIAVISDGVRDERYEACAARHGARYTLGSYLKRTECGGAWWERLFRAGLAMDRPWIVKLDPDAKVWRPFRGGPPRPISGTIEGRGTENENIQGGCQFISAAAARRIVDSPLVSDPTLTRHATFAPDHATYREWIARAYLCTDKTLLWFARNLGIDYGNWEEVGSSWLPPAPENAGLRYAVTHPHKLEPDPRFRGVPLRVITTCKGRRDHLEQTLPRWVAEPGVSVTVVDYDCPQGTAGWVRANHPGVRVVHARGLPRFNLAHARNLGAARSPAGWWCFWDADCLCEPGWADAVRESLRHRRYLLARPIDWGQFGSVVVHSSDYAAAGGYDELFRAWGSEDSDFYARLRHQGVRPGSFPGAYFSSIKHSDAERTAFYAAKVREQSRLFYDAYIARKVAFMLATGRLPSRDDREAFLSATATERGLPECAAFYPVSDPEPVEVEVVIADEGGREVVEVITETGDGVELKIEVVDKPTAPATPRDIEIDVESRPTPGLPHPAGPATRFDAPHAVASGTHRGPHAPWASGRPATRGGVAQPLGVPAIITRKEARTMRNISVINHATVGIGIDLRTLCALGNRYVTDVVIPWWGETKAASLVPTTRLLPGAWAMVIMDDADQQGALGYHDVTPEGLPLVKVFARTAEQDGATVTEVFTHELAEMLCDPDCNLQATDGKGTIYALEVADPVESTLFTLHGFPGHPVSDLVTPAWFEPFHAPGSQRFDHCNVLTQPFQLAHGGYAVVTDPTTGNQQQIFGSIEKQLLFEKEDRRFHRSEVRQTRREYARGHAFGQYYAAAGNRRPVLTHA